MRSLSDHLRRTQELVDLVLQGLEVIAALTATKRDDQALAALRSIASVVGSLRSGLAGTVDAATVETYIRNLRETVTSSDEAAFDALRAKFGV